VRWEARILRGKKRAYESPSGKLAVTEARWLGTVTFREHTPCPPESRWRRPEIHSEVWPPHAQGPGERPPRLTEGRCDPQGQGPGAWTESFFRDAEGRSEASGGALRLQHWSLRPLTGRPHQLRFELSRRGWPVWGDALYGSARPFPIPGGIALRAVSLDLGACPEAPRLGLPAVLEVTPLLSSLR
jgi:hypothetical protein